MLKTAFNEGIPIVSAYDYRFMESFNPSLLGAFDGGRDIFLAYNDLEHGAVYGVSSDGQDFELTVVKQLVDVGFFDNSYSSS